MLASHDEGFDAIFAKSSRRFDEGDYHESFAFAQMAMERADATDQIARAYDIMAESLLRAGGRSIQLGKPIDSKFVAAPDQGPIMETHYFRLLQQATLWWDKAGKKSQVAANLFAAATEYMKRGDYEHAIDFLNRCAATAKSIDDKHTFANVMGELGDLARAAGKYKEGLKYTWNAYVIFDEEQSPQRKIAEQVMKEIEGKVGCKNYTQMLADVKGGPLLY